MFPTWALVWTVAQALIMLTCHVSRLIFKIGKLIIPKGYVVANISVTDQEKFQQFSGMAGPAITKYGGKVLARGQMRTDLRAMLVASL